tara:strand:- start:96 stop:1157 length:1062 start_codon:yes stop_codon:yes gene_type:complete
MKQDLQFGSLLLRHDRPFLIAEAGVNHENSLDTAFRMIEEAAQAGADAIKFQSYKAETLATRDSPAYWDLTAEPCRTQFELFKKYDHFTESDYEQLARYAARCGIVFMSTPFDIHFADVLDPWIPAFKIASADLTNVPLIEHCARKGKPMILSVGAACDEEVDEAVKAVRETGNPQIALLHCVLSYPCRPEDANLNSIAYLTRRYPEFLIGYSDHVPPDMGMLVPITAWLLGARIIEKHFTLDKTIPGNDHYHAMDPDDIRRFRQSCGYMASSLGDEVKQVWPCETEARRHARRSLVANESIRKDQVVEEDAIAIKRPGTGIPPKDLKALIGRKALKDIEPDEILHWDMFSET